LKYEIIGDRVLMGIKRAVESCAIQKKVVNLFANREIASNAMALASLNSAVFWGGDLSNQELIEGCSLNGIDGMCAVMDDFFVAADSITYCHLIKLTEIVGTLDKNGLVHGNLCLSALSPRGHFQHVWLPHSGLFRPP
jgi:hypothetical protein